MKCSSIASLTCLLTSTAVCGFLSISAAAQSVQFFANYPGSAGGISQPLVAGGTVWLDSNDDTATITVDATLLPSCQSVSYKLSVTYTDPSTNYLTAFDQPLSLVNGGYSADVPILYEGGTAMLSYRVQSEPWQQLPFVIHGTNLSAARLRDTLYTYNAPSYFGNMLHQESNFTQFTSSGLPLVAPDPDGIGIGQWDAVANRAVFDRDYWSSYQNIGDNLALFASKKTSAVAFWNNQLIGWINDPSFAQVTPPVVVFPYCTFGYPASFGAYGYDDGIAIQYYNTANVKFIVFTPSSSTQTGSFTVNQTAYTSMVCGKSGP